MILKSSSNEVGMINEAQNNTRNNKYGEYGFIFTASFIPKIEQFACGYVQYRTNIENNVQRNRAISGFYSAHVGSADVDFLRQLALGHSA